MHPLTSCPISSARAPALSLCELIERFSEPVGHLLRRLGVAQADLDDVRQRVWLVLARRLEQVQPGAERAFVMAVARREAGHLRRSYRRRSEVTLGVEEEGASPALAGEEWVECRQRWERAAAVLAQMDQSLSTVLRLCELEGASARDVARLLDIPIGTAKSRLRRARAQFSIRAAA